MIGVGVRDKMVLTKDFSEQYLICKNKHDETSKNGSRIIVNNRNEIQLFLSILKDNVKVYEPDFIEDKEIIDWLFDKTIEDILEDFRMTRKTILEVKDILPRIGIPNQICEELSLSKYDSRVKKELVHKVNEQNVMLSDFYRLPNTDMLFSKVIIDTEEINLDHVSDDHVQSMVLAEVCRQSTVLAASIVQDPKLRFIVTQDIKNYKNFVVNNQPSYIQMLCMTPKKKGAGFSMFNIVQDGKSCVHGYLVGYSYLR